MGEYFDNLLTNLELPAHCTLNVLQDKYIYKRNDKPILFTVHPAVMYLMRSYRYFQRRLKINRVSPEEVKIYLREREE